MQLVVFVLASMMVLGGGICVVIMRNPVHAALSLVLTLFGVAVHFVAMEAHFLAAVQVIVYAGAIVVLFLFVLMLLGVDKTENLRIEPLPVQRPLAAVMGVALVGLIIAAVIDTRGVMLVGVGEGIDVAGNTASAEGAGLHDANIRQLSDNLFSQYVFAFELTSVLLVVAVAGTVLMTRKLPDRPDDEERGVE
jgi:NADH-quinone oxidoreductase subunit J